MSPEENGKSAKSWSIEYFSISNPSGANQADVPALLRRVAESLEHHGTVEVQDLVFRNEVVDGNDWPSVTVYFNRGGAE